MENRRQDLTLTDRRLLKVTGVEAVNEFDDKNVILKLADGSLLVQGTGMTVSKLNVDSGEVEIEGLVSLIRYQNKKENLLKRILK